MNVVPVLGAGGLRLPLGTRVTKTKHARREGNPYPPEMHETVCALWLDGGNAALRTPRLDQLRMQNPPQFPHFTTCMSWIQIHLAAGHVRPKRHTGNIFSQREINGVDLFNLTLFHLIRPKVYICKVKAYNNNMNPDNQPYSDSQISWAEQRLGPWLKVGSTTSDQAYRPINLLKRWNYWREAYPLGVRGEDTDYIIDIDEAKFKLESQDCKRGKVTQQRQCDARGRYKKGAGGINLIMGW
jgi:hypothetical protein